MGTIVGLLGVAVILMDIVEMQEKYKRRKAD